MPEQIQLITQTSLKQYIKKWRDDPILFVQEVCGAEPEEWQKDALLSFRDNPRTILRASKGPGKSCVLAWAALWFLTCFTYSQIFITSINASNLKSGLAKEIRYWLEEAPQSFQSLFSVTKTRIEDKSAQDTHFIESITWAKDADSKAQADSLTGKHAENICFLIDEIGSMNFSVLVAADAIFSSAKTARIMCAGNTNSTTGAMHKVTEDPDEKQRWNCISITGNPDDPKRSKRVSAEWARGLISSLGRDSPYVAINIFGEFPKVALHTLLSLPEIRACSEREIDEGSAGVFVPAVGIDVARGGEDSTVIVGRQGAKGFPPMYIPQVQFRGRDIVTALHQYIKEHWYENARVNVYCDNTGGFGSSVMDIIHESGEKARGVHFHERADDPDSYFNKRSEMYARLRDWMRTKGRMPWEEKLADELSVMEYFFSSGGSKMQIESKELIRDKIGRSPDCGDALALTFTEKDSMLEKPKRRPSGTGREYDPLENSRIGMA